MHRHGYQGRKLSRATDQRRALVRGQVTSLVLHEAIITTEPKAREIAPHFERLVTKAKQGDLAGQRAIRQVLTSENAAKKLMLELAPAFAERNGGYTRIVKLPNRRGDNAPMAQVSLVLDKVVPAEVVEAPKATKVTKAPAAKKAETK
jgi:large subunit ribosomal protein L17